MDCSVSYGATNGIRIYIYEWMLLYMIYILYLLLVCEI